jgi:hypothetical protein
MLLIHLVASETPQSEDLINSGMTADVYVSG